MILDPHIVIAGMLGLVVGRNGIGGGALNDPYSCVDSRDSA